SAPPSISYPLSLHDALPIYLRSARARGDDAASTSRFGDPGFSDRKRRMDSGYQRSGPGKEQRVARRACVVGRERISNLVANGAPDRKSTRLNSSHVSISYAV